MTSPAKNPSDISREEGNALISLAQRSIMQRLGLAVVASADLDQTLGVLPDYIQAVRTN